MPGPIDDLGQLAAEPTQGLIGFVSQNAPRWRGASSKLRLFFETNPFQKSGGHLPARAPRACRGARPLPQRTIIWVRLARGELEGRGARLLALQRLESKEGLGELSPERRLISTEPVHDVAVEIGQAQKADRDVTRCIRRVELEAQWVLYRGRHDSTFSFSHVSEAGLKHRVPILTICKP